MTLLPNGWKTATIADTCDILDNKRKPLNSAQRLEMKGTVPYYGANGVVDYINDFIFDEELILMAEDGGNFSDYLTRPIAYKVQGKSWVNNHAHVLRAKPQFNQDYLFYALEHKDIQPVLNGGTRAKLNKSELERIELLLPASVEEQHQIAAILTAVDDKLDVIARQIEATQTLKQGLMQTLFSRGSGAQDADGRWIPHNEFKDSVLGAIPSPWEALPIGDLFEVVERPVKMSDEQRYRRVTVKRRYGGIELRDELRGSEIKVKSQFALEEGDFLISERQIVHGACGIVPRPLAGALVSNEYLVLRATEGVDVRYFNYLVQQLKYSKYFFLCSQGVDIEKFLFKPRDWLKKMVPVPPISEQTRIADVLSTVDSKLDALRHKQVELQQMKRGLMQKLLTGEWRVKFDAEMTA